MDIFFEERRCVTGDSSSFIQRDRHLGFVNIIDRRTRDITGLEKHEHLPGGKKIFRIINAEIPKVVCFIGKVAYEKDAGSKDFSFGWQDPIGKSRAYVMHFSLRGEAIIRIRELREIKRTLKNL